MVIKPAKKTEQMNAYRETELRNMLRSGDDISIDVIDTFTGEEIDSKIFNNRTHQIEEVLDYITANEYEYDVYF